MKEELISLCEKSFPLKAIFQDVRLDGRKFDEYRKLDISFGKEWGSCQVSLGETKVMAQVTCDIQQPKTTRPNEGLLFINTELSPMGAMHFEPNTQSDLSVYLNRLLEKCFKESRCVDLESLCIVAEEKVWNLRVDLVVLNYDGNLIGSCSIAALAALCHFRRPDVTTNGEEVIIHNADDKDPIPISLHHHPVAVSFAIFLKGDDARVIVDPTTLEEKSSDAELVLSVNTYRELCGLHLAGAPLTAPHVLMECAHRASKHAKFIADLIKQELQKDSVARLERNVTGLLDLIKLDRYLSFSEDRSCFVSKESTTKYNHNKGSAATNGEDSDVLIVSDDEIQEIISTEKGSAELQTINKPWEPSGGASSWFAESNSESSESEENSVQEIDSDNNDDVEILKTVTVEDRVLEHIELSGDSEEDDIVILDAEVINEGPEKSRKSRQSHKKS